MEALGEYLLPLIILLITATAFVKRLPAIDLFIEGATEAFKCMLMLFIRLSALVFSVKLLLNTQIFHVLSEKMAMIGKGTIPAELWPLILLNPVSGAASLAVTEEIYQLYGPDTAVGLMASVIQGSTDTTLYIVTVYFGAIGIKRTKEALSIGLAADFIGIITAVLVAKWFFF